MSKLSRLKYKKILEIACTGICDYMVSVPSNQNKTGKKSKNCRNCVLIASRHFFTWFFGEQMVSLLFVNWLQYCRN